MYCGQCCLMEPRSRAALRLDIFIEILLESFAVSSADPTGPSAGSQGCFGSPACYPELGGQSHLNMVRQVPVFRGLGRQCSWKEGWK
jgi:hypothetical protein